MFKEIGVVDKLEDLRTDEGKKLIIEMKRLIRANKVIILIYYTFRKINSIRLLSIWSYYSYNKIVNII
jgi:hypothetical protein